jgi:hypothetical protein
MMTLIAVQDQYVEAINSGFARWSDKGHFPRISRGARHTAEKQLRRIGFTDEKQIRQVIKDAFEMAALIRNADE